MKMDVYPMLSKSSSFPLIRPNYRRMVSDCAADGEWGGGMKRVDYSLLGGVLVDSASAKVAARGASDSDRPSWITKKETSVVLPRMVAKRFKLMTRAFVTLWKSKLRKREDTLPTTTTATPPATTATTNANHNHNNNVIQHSNNHILSNGVQQQNNNNNSCNQQQQQQTDVIEGPPPPFLWVYHTNGTSTTNSSQYTLYNNDQDTLVHNLQCEEARECKGFRKNLRGKWRRLVKKKPQQEVYTIPAELRDQLKQIYVY